MGPKLTPIDVFVNMPPMWRAGSAKWFCCVAVFAALILPATAQASGQVFYGGWYDSAIGSVSFDGSNPQPNLIVNQLTVPFALAVSGEYLYWESNSFPVDIGRSRLDGSELNPQFITAPGGAFGSNGLSISNGRIYWSETRNSTGFGPALLSSANLDGSDQQNRFLSLGSNAAGASLVIGGWAFLVTHKEVRGVEHYSIARRRLDGKGSRRLVAANRPFVGEALVGDGSHIYWLEGEDRNLFIARASINAGSLNTRWRHIPRKGCHVHEDIGGIAISSEFLFLGCPGGDVDRVALRGRTRVKMLSTGAALGSGPVLAATP